MLRLLISAVLVFVTVTPQAPTKLDSYDVPEAYEVYSAIFPGEWSWKDAHAEWLVISGTTMRYEMCLEPDEQSQKIIGGAIADYLQQNKQPRMLQRKFSLAEMPYTILTPEEQRAAFENSPGGGEAFYGMYVHSGGLIEVSAVGFNTDKSIAVVYVGHECGSLCGGGEFHVLQNKAGKWEPLEWKGMRCAWAS
jgi:hypothetical protein